MNKFKDSREIEFAGEVMDPSWAPSRYRMEDDPSGIGDFTPNGISRRRFLSLLSASSALALGASCSRMDRGSIVPYTRRPDEVIPGVATYYASTFQEGWNVQGVLVKTREGRPIHIEGNPEHPVSRGTVSLRAMGDLLGLYDSDRLRAPVFEGKASTWNEAERAMTRVFEDARDGGRKVLLLTGAVMSPSQAALIKDLQRSVTGLRHVSWEPAGPQSQALMISALYGDGVIPELHLERATVILSLQSDFLGNDGNTAVSIHDFASRRRISEPSDRMSRLWVVEGPMTLTGANADERIRVRPSGIDVLAFTLVRILHESHGLPLPFGLGLNDLKPFAPDRPAGVLDVDASRLKQLAKELSDARGSALVLTGPSLPAKAYLASYILNSMIEAYDNMADPPSGIPVTGECVTNLELGDLLDEAAEGKYAAAIFWGANPAYAFPGTELWGKAVDGISETFRVGLYEDETARSCSWRLPEHHWLESWGDFESSSEYVSLRQPTIGPLYDTRQGEDILLSCMRNLHVPVPASYLKYIKGTWKSDMYPQGSPVPFEDFWNAALHNGGAPFKRKLPEVPRTGWKWDELYMALVPDEHKLQEADSNGSVGPSKEGSGDSGQSLASALNSLKDALKSVVSEEIKELPADSIDLVLMPAAGVYDGRYANNGWLNELPDPVTKATWGNPVSLSARDAGLLGAENGDVVEVSNGEVAIEVPVMVQPGQCDGVAALALGYGRRNGNVAAGVGVNAYPLLRVSPGSSLLVPEVKIRRKAEFGSRPIPQTQMYDRMGDRDLARTWTLAQYARFSGAPESGEEKEHDAHHDASLIPERKFPGHKWSMVVDLSACVGCSACVIACQSENNVPVVGPERVLKGRHMHWIRIDRYYAGDSVDPSVVHQPMFCQHCDDAPCEIVCPVNATTHSPDGLNQMTYNRCVGTRYCSNNCPFKVRRFNFFDYTSMKKEPESLVFNPEVTVRPRGVMEKCTFCIQRIQNARQKANVEGRKIKDGDIVPACAGACPARAIVFGDLNDPESRVAGLSKSNRAYHMLEELGIKPSVTYLADVSNPAEEEKA